MSKSSFKNIKFSALSLLILVLSFSLSCNNIGKRNQNQVEQLLGIKLSQDVQVINYEKVSLSSEFTRPYYAYMQLEMPEEFYTDIAQQLGLALHQESEGPIFWVNQRIKQDKFSPDWWNPPLSAYGNLSADGEFRAAQNGGWMVSIYQNRAVYIKVFEEGTP